MNKQYCTTAYNQEGMREHVIHLQITVIHLLTQYHFFFTNFMCMFNFQTTKSFFFVKLLGDFLSI